MLGPKYRSFLRDEYLTVAACHVFCSPGVLSKSVFHKSQKILYTSV